MEYVLLFVGAILVNNVVFSQFLGICPFLGVSKKLDTALGMGAAVTFVVTIATLVTFGIQKLVLDPFGIQFMQNIAFILVIASVVQMLEIILKKISPSLYSALGVFLPLITTNCMVLGVAISVIQSDFNLAQAIIYAIGSAIGYTFAISIFAVIREQLAKTKIPHALAGVPIALISAGILAMAFMGFTGLV